MKWKLVTIIFLIHEIAIIVISVFQTAFKGYVSIVSSLKLHIKNYVR